MRAGPVPTTRTPTRSSGSRRTRRGTAAGASSSLRSVRRLRASHGSTSLRRRLAGVSSYGKNDFYTSPTWKHTTQTEFDITSVKTLPRVDIIYAYADMPGDLFTPRMQFGASGASERMVVSPGHEANGVVHMPGGQSGHPLSPFWGAGHDAWVRGEPTPFLPGAPVYAFGLRP